MKFWGYTALSEKGESFVILPGTMTKEHIPTPAAIPEEMVAAPEKTDAVPVPDELFEAWLKANLKYPQASLGIFSYVGAELFASDMSLSQFLRSELTESQIGRIVGAMQVTHNGRGIFLPHTQAPNDAKRVINTLKFAADHLNPNLLNDALKEEGILSEPEEALISKDFLEDVFAKDPSQKAKVLLFFMLCMEGLQTDEVKKLEKERRKALDFTRKSVEEKKVSHAKIALLNDKISALVSEYVSRQQGSMM